MKYPAACGGDRYFYHCLNNSYFRTSEKVVLHEDKKLQTKY
jgi:hypothetical protein